MCHHELSRQLSSYLPCMYTVMCALSTFIFIPEQPPVVPSPRHLTLWVRVLPSRPWTVLGD